MAIDTAKKRRSASAAAGLPFIPTPPAPDGDIDAQDRAALAGVHWRICHWARPTDSSSVVWTKVTDRVS